MPRGVSHIWKVTVKVLVVLAAQSCPTLCDPTDYSPPGSSVSRQENWSGLPFPPPRDLPDPGMKPGSPALQADALPPELLQLKLP